MRPWGPARHFLLPTLVLGIVVGCGGGGAGVTGGGGTLKTNTPPTVVGLTVSPGDALLVRYKAYTLTAQASDPDIGDTILRYEWDFGNNVLVTTTGPNLRWAFTTTGTVTVKVRAVDASGAAGAWATFTASVDTSTTPITAAFTNPASGATVQAESGGFVQVVYNITATSTSTAPILLSGITFAPGEVGATVISSQDDGGGKFTFVVRYAGASSLGTRTVSPTVLVSDTAGVSSDLVTGPAVNIRTVSGVNRAPSLTVTNPGSPTSNGYTTKPVSMDFLVSDPDSDIVNYTVDWGDGTPASRATVAATPAGVAVNLTHAYPDSFTSGTRSATVRVNATDNRSSNSNAIEQVRTFNILFNAYPVATITSPQASATRPTNGEITGGLPTGYVNPPTATDPDIVVIPNGGKLTFAGTSTLPGSGDAALTYAWTFQGGAPASSSVQNPGDVTFSVTPGTIVPLLVELKVNDAFSRSSASGPTANAKTYRKWVVVDGVNTQNFQLSYMYRLRSDNNGTVSLTPARNAANGYGSSVQIFQDGVSNTYQVQNPAAQAVAVLPVRSNLPFYVKLGAFGNDTRNYLIRIPNAPTGPFADPNLGTVLRPTSSSFGFLNGAAPYNPALQIVTAEGFASENTSAAERRIQGVVGPGMVVTGATPPANTRYLDRLSVPLLTGDSLGAIQWTQTSNFAAGFENIRANQQFGEWVALLLNISPNDALTAEVPRDTNSSTPGTATDFGFIVDYPTYIGDSATSKTFAQTRLQAFRVPPGSTDPYDLSVAGWGTGATTVALNPLQLSIGGFYQNIIYNGTGSTPLTGGIQSLPIPYDANDPDRRPYAVGKIYNLQNIRQVFSYAEYLWSSVWARPVVLNTAKLAYSESDTTSNLVVMPPDYSISTYPYFRRSNPGSWPVYSGIVPDGSSFNMTVSGAGTFNPASSPVAIGGPAASTGVGRFYWTAFTPYYGLPSGTMISRTWLSDASGNPPTTFSGGSGDATSALGFLPPQDVVVDKRGRNADGTLNGQPLGGYRLTWFNPTKDNSSNPVAPDFWVIEVTSNGQTYHFTLPGSYPVGAQSVNDLILTDARTFLPSGNSAVTGAASDFSDRVAPGYCWFDIPAELRPNAGQPSSSATIMVFAVKSVLRNSPSVGARALTAADWVDAIKTATANVKITTNAGDVSYAHKIPFNFFWDIVVVNGPKTFVAP